MKVRKIFALLLSASSAVAAVIEWRVEDGGNGHFYELVGEALNITNRWDWNESKALAEIRGGHLATIGSAAENAWLIKTFLTAHPWSTWIGLSYFPRGERTQATRTPAGWQWVTGEPVQFSSFFVGSPDNTQGSEDGVLIGSQYGDHHLWNDSQISDDAAFLVEYDGLAARRTSGIFNLQWRTRPGSTYQIEQSRDFKNWTPLVEMIATSDVATFAPVSDGSQQRFFRFIRK